MESALAHIATIKLSAPDCEMKSVNARVAAIERTAKSDELRYKAYIVGRGTCNEPDELFAAIANRMVTYSTAR